MPGTLPVYWIGIDEAGYKTRLGPLVISSSMWRVRDPQWDLADWQSRSCLQELDRWDWTAQFPACRNSPGAGWPPHLVADSKRVYQAGRGLTVLRQVVESLLAAEVPGELASSVGRSSACDTDRFGGRDGWALAAESDLYGELTLAQQDFWRVWWQVEPSLARAAWQSTSQENLAEAAPYWLLRGSVGQDHPGGQAGGQLGGGAGQAPAAGPEVWSSPHVKALGLRSRVVDELSFNRGLNRYGNKANLLSSVSMGLVREALVAVGQEFPVLVDLDRHGGRKRYLSLLMGELEADWIQVVEENPRESLYLWRRPEGEAVYFRFSVDGERRYPVAMASMQSKYARELAMLCLNEVWRQRIPGIQATAGYPQDAARFVAQLRSQGAGLSVADEALWRNA